MTGRGREWPLDWQLAVAGAVAVLIVAGYLGVLAQTGREDSTGGVQPVRPPTAEIVADAEQVLRDSGRIAEINEGQAWETSQPAYRRVPERGDLVTFLVEWDEPVTSNGPWVALECQFTWLVEDTITWENVTRVRATVDLQAGEVIELTPQDLALDDGGGDARRVESDDDELFQDFMVRDAATGEVLEAQTRQLQRAEEIDCPEGLEDEEVG
ncbi:MAG: hypothetical protein U5Q44_00490 [Dehalococcoidia bacterium]|nr:hypothetical protein [Dehalococcoidia bacterium]